MTALALALFYGTAIALEASIASWRGLSVYDPASSETNVGLIFFGWLFAAPVAVFLTMSVINFGYAHRLANFGAGPLAPFAVILLCDFLHYCRHVANHRFRWMWATHFVHHSDRSLNFLTALREGWTDIISGSWLVWTPLGFLGFKPETCIIYFVAVSVWQLLVHNVWTGKLGVLEWALVTPSNHRVHHSTNPDNFNANYGGILIVWDRLFGTYRKESEQGVSEFGLPDYPNPAINPAAVAFREWASMWQDFRAAWFPGRRAAQSDRFN